MITIRNLDKVFQAGQSNEFTALQGINLKVAAGDLVVLEGVSGSGKTTLLAILAALSRPTRGEVLVDDKAIAKLPDRHASAFRSRTVGLVPQALHLLDELSVHHNVALPLIPRGLAQAEVDRRVDRVLHTANIAHKAGQRVNTLSGGEKQRCAMARALVTRPRVLLCDEPTANLDRQNSLQFLSALASLKQEGVTTVVATHDPLVVNHHAVDRVLHLKDGRLVGDEARGS